MALCAVNFCFIDPLTYQEGATQLGAVEVNFSFPQRYHVNARRFTLAASMFPKPAWAPRERLVAAQQPSALWNQSMLCCDQPLYIPRRGSIEWGLSAFTPWAIGDQVGEFQTEVAHATMGYQEGPRPGGGDDGDGGLFAGSMRAQRVLLPFMDGTATSQILFDNEHKWPYPPDANFVPGALPPGGPLTAQGFWDPRAHFTSKNFDRQESTRSGSTEITDLRVAVDQRAADAEMQTGLGTANQPSPLSMRIGTRIRTTASGTNAWWWRPGAPLALVFDKITPANVYHLPQPVTLRPGDSMDVEMIVPAPFAGGEGPVQPSGYHIGVAFNGYATIEG